MTEQRRLAEALACTDTDKHAMHRLLRRWGFRGTTLDFDRWLQYLIHLTPVLRRVGDTYPNLHPTTSQFLNAGALRERLHAVLAERQRTLVPTGAPSAERLAIVHAAFDTRAPASASSTANDDVSPRGGHSRFQPSGVPVTTNVPAALLLEAAAMVLHSIWNGYTQRLGSDVLPATRVIDTFTPGRRFASLWSTIGADTDLAEPFSFLGRIRQFIEDTPAYERLDGDEYPRNLGAHDWKAFETLLQDTRLDETYGPTLANCVPTDLGAGGHDAAIKRKTDRRWGDRCSTELNDRELLPESTYGLSDETCHRLSFRMRATEPSSSHTESRAVVASGALAFVLNVAIHTGRTPTEAFDMRVRACPERDVLTNGDDAACGDEIIIVPSATRRWARETWWRPARFQETGTILHVASSPPQWPEKCIDFELGELFALPPDELASEVSAGIGGLLGTSRAETLLVVKHALAREMHSFNANRAAIDFVCGRPTPPGAKAVARGSLSRYIHPRSASVTNAYQVAQLRLATGRREAVDHNTLAQPSDGDAGMWIPAAAMREVVARLREAVRVDDPAKVLKQHRRFAFWTLALIDAAIGGRESAHPMHFPFDVDTEESVAFVADKIAAGREARFVPLVELAIEQWREYVRHVRWLVAWLRPRRRRLADAIEVAMGWRQSSEPRGAHAAGVFFTVRGDRLVPINTAMIDTVFARLARAAGLPDEIRLDVRARRRNLATFLANVGASGMAVEAHLGHAGDQHPFGASSSWIPLEHAARLRPLISRYMAVNGWTLMPAHWVPPTHGKTPGSPMPAFPPAQEAYEARALSADAARDRARAALREVLDAEDLEREEAVEIDEGVITRLRAALARLTADRPATHADASEALDAMIEQWRVGDRYEIASRFLATREDRIESWRTSLTPDSALDSIAVRDCIRAAIRSVLSPDELKNLRSIRIVDEGTVGQIRERIRDDLADDPGAQSKVLAAFAEWMSLRRRRAGFVVTAASVNLARFAPGHVTVSFGRHLAIARFIRTRAFEVIRDVLDHAKHRGPPEKRPLVWLAAIVVLLPLCDGVLAEAEMPPLLDALQAGDLGHHEGQLQLRATVTTGQAIYDRTVDLTDLTAAAVVGFRRLGSVTATIPFEAIRRCADELVLRIAGQSSGMTMLRLMLVMRPYWFLRWPGSAYASAVGGQECNAPPESSLRLLLGGTAEALPSSQAIADVAKKVKAARPGDAMALALKETRALLQKARGELARNEANSRAQRRRLRLALHAGVSAALADLMSQHQVVELWVTFLQYLLEVGGVRVDTYKFNTLVTYQSRVLEEAYRVGWDVDLLSLDEDGFADFYERVLSDLEGQPRADASNVLQRFHECLRAWYGAPRCALFPSIERPPRMARSLVVPARIVQETVALAAKPGGRRSAEGSAAAGQLVLQYSHGLRSLEGHGLRHRDFLREGAGPLRIERNTTRSLKTLQRTIPLSVASAALRAEVDVRFKQTIRHTHRDRDTSLFPDPKDLDRLIDYPTVAGIASRAIKVASGDATAIPYHLRHSFATMVMSAMLMPQASKSRIACAIGEALALPEEAIAERAACWPADEVYPFTIDRLGMWMAHRGHETVAVKYWHGAWWVIGEYCARQSMNDDLPPAVFAAFEGVDRAIIVRRMAQADAKVSRRERLAGAVRAGVERSGIEALVPKNSVAARALTSSSTAPMVSSPVVATDLSLSLVDILLILRRRYSEDFDKVAARCASDLALHVDQISRFFAAYGEVGSMTQMFDFEPDDVRSGRDAMLGVDGGHPRRCELLARIEGLASESEDYRVATAAIARDWKASVSAKQPRLISRSPEGLRTHVRWLVDAGYDPSEIEVACHAVPEALLPQVKELGVSTLVADRHHTRMARIGSRQEFGISIAGARKLPNGRDFQRVLLGLAVWFEIELPSPGAIAIKSKANS